MFIHTIYTLEIIFVSGDQHWAELMAKEMPASAEHGPSVVLHEVTASGIDQHWDETIYNANRLRARTADNRGDGVFQYECNFPFEYNGVTYTSCTSVGEPQPWCSVQTSGGVHVAGKWGYCLPEEDELAQVTSFSGAHTCTDELAHVCTAQVTMTIWDYIKPRVI